MTEIGFSSIVRLRLRAFGAEHPSELVMASGGSSYEATEAGHHLSFWENAFFLRKRNQIRVSLYVSHNTR